MQVPKWPTVLILTSVACAWAGTREPATATAMPGEEPVSAPVAAAPASSRVNMRSQGEASEDASTQPACPEGMVLLSRAQGPYCIDRYEATLEHRLPDGSREAWPGNQKIDGREAEFVAVSRPGVKPQGYVSGTQAATVCENAGKRLCEIDEWVRACRGPESTRYPYANERKPGKCNDRYQKLDHHPVVRLFHKEARPGTDPKLMWHPSWMNDSRLHELSHSVSPTGAFTECTNEFGAYDMVGNLHEWVADEDGTFMGGFFMDTFQNGEGCEYRTIAHPVEYHDYSTGFRCCADPASDADS